MTEPESLDTWFKREIVVHEGALDRYLLRAWSNPHDVFDLRQDVYVRVYEAAVKARPHAPRAFLFVTARHLLTDRLRRKRVVAIDAVGDPDSLNVLVEDLSPEHRASAHQELRRLAEALDNLPPRCRDAVWLRRVDEIPQKEVARLLGLTPKMVEKHLRKGILRLTAALFGSDDARPARWDAPGTGMAFDEYVSDPARPVPYRQRPIPSVGYEPPYYTWKYWLVDDQREFSGRTDVLTYVTSPLEKSLAIAGEPVANLVAATTGTDIDWVVKLIDVYPSEVPGQSQMGGYQLAVAMDIFRGRYREDPGTPKPVKPNAVLTYRFALPTTHHVFLPGHRIMIQVQSSWFPLYDRNPQTFVPNIFEAQPADFRKATQRIYHAPGKASFVELPVVP